MHVKLPWRKSESSATALAPSKTAVCTHPSVDVEMRGTAVKRRWCKLCGQELPVEERWNYEQQ
ncbi:MAG: hypothetical protein ACRDIY_04095 [Chloroflexota bacterium]